MDWAKVGQVGAVECQAEDQVDRQEEEVTQMEGTRGVVVFALEILIQPLGLLL